jgi:hypothetical protein
MQLTFFGRARGEPDRRRHGSEINQHLAAEQVGKRGRLSAIRHVHHVDTRHHLEQLTCHMGRAPNPGRRHGDLARIGFNVSDKFRNRLSWKRWVNYHHVGHAGDTLFDSGEDAAWRRDPHEGFGIGVGLCDEAVDGDLYAHVL